MGILPHHPHRHSVEQLDSIPNSSLTPQPSIRSIPTVQSSAAAAVHCIATLKGHSSHIFSLVLAGKRLYSGSADGEIRLWCHDAGHAVGGGYSSVKSIIVLGDKLFTAHQDHRIRIWRIDGGAAAPCHRYRMVAALPTVNDRCLRAFSPGSYVSVRRHRRRTWVHHVDAVSCLAVSADGALLYSVSWDRTLKVWRTSDFRCVESVQAAHDDAVSAVVASPDGGGAYTSSADGTVKVWRILAGERRHALFATMRKHKSAVNALAISADGSVLYSGASDRSIIVWERTAGCGGNEVAAVGALRGHTKAVLCLAVVVDVLCSGSADRTVRIWRRDSGDGFTCLAVLKGHRGPVKCLTATSDDCTEADNDSRKCYLVYSGSLDFDIKVWQVWVQS